MKSPNMLINSIYTKLLELTELTDYLGSFNALPSIAYNSVPMEYTLPTRDKVFIVYSLDTIDAKKSETKTHLHEMTLKFYVSGDEALAVSEVLASALDSTLVASYTCSYKGTQLLPNHDTTVRFTLI